MILEDLTNDRDTLEDGNLAKSWYIKQNLMELACGVFNVIGLGIGFIAYDLDTDLSSMFSGELTSPLSADESMSIKTYLYWLLLVSTILLSKSHIRFILKYLILVLLVMIRYYVKLRWYQIKKILPKNWRLLPNSLLFGLILEIFIVILIPNPFMLGIYIYIYAVLIFYPKEATFQVNNSITNTWVTYKLNDIMVLLMLLRIIIIVRIILSNTRYYTNSAFRVWFYN